jgi:hypothetical protein
MKGEWKAEWESMTIDELMKLRDLMQDVLSTKLKAKKEELERKLQTLNKSSSNVDPTDDA